MKVAIISIPKKMWQRNDLRSAVEDVLGAGRRIGKKIDLKHQRKIFSSACNYIEKKAVENGEDYIEFKGKDVHKIIMALKNDQGITYPFVLPKEMSKFKSYFKDRILKYLQKIEGGIVVIPLFYQEPSRDFQVNPLPSLKKRLIIDQDFLPILDLSNISDIRYREYLKKASQQLNEAILSNQPFNASAFSHKVFTLTIREYIERHSFKQIFERIYKNKKKPFSYRLRKLIRELIWEINLKSFPLRIIYNDGSEARPFPLFCLKRISLPKGFPIIKMGLMSMRHGHEGLDYEVDIYLLRNREIDRRESCADQDDIAYNRTIEFLSELLKEKEGIEIHLYHTGLQPAVVGTYRAITEILQKYQGKLVVISKFPIYKGKEVIGYRSSEKIWI